eukprot:TRINITY_DN9624_c0_g1_i3.p1 TRINITY_DN9624_c0_g1~~TRINITY_DN9624_c0_g1_i3.p1  ORF type:complete len:285 (+),score=67.40 TRINITY_DN9624_c0_g1_i3:490-1344(+)
MCNQYKHLHGPESLMPHRKEPMPFTLIEQLLTHFEQSPSIQDYLRVQLCAITALLAQSGMRKAEVASPDGVFAADLMSRANLCWHIDGRYEPNPTAEQLRSMVPHRDHAVLTPPPSKADQLGVVWGNLPIYLVYAPNMSVNAATRLMALELALPCSGTDRRNTPMFALAGRPVKISKLDTILKATLAVLAPEDAHKYSWHSFRIALACSLLAAGKTGPEIQAICRWQSEESLRLYARMRHQQYTDLLLSAYNKDLTQIQASNLPVCIDEAEMVRLNLEHLEVAE